MAKDIQVNLKLNTKEATQSADTFAKSLDNVATEAKDAEKSLADASAKGASNFEDQLKKLNKTIKEAPVDIRKMNKQIQEYQALALNAGRNTPVGKKALMEAAQLRDKYVDIQNEVKRLSADGMRLQGALDLGSTVVGGFAAFKGVSAALGTENEELQQTFVKLQGAQSALMGIEVIRKNLEKESTLMLMRKQAAEKISLIGTKALTAANKVFNTTLKANPIAIVVTAVLALTGVIVAFADKIKSAVMPIVKPLTGAFNFLKDAVIGIGSALGLTASKSERAMAKMNAAAQKAKDDFNKAEREKLDAVEDAEEDKRSARIKSFDIEIAKLQAAGVATFDIEQKKLQYVLDSIDKQKKALQTKIDFEKSLGDEGSFFAEKAAEARIMTLEAEGEKASQQLELNQIKENKQQSDDWKKKQDTKKKQADQALKAEQARLKAEQDLTMSSIEAAELRVAEQLAKDEERRLAAIETDKAFLELQVKNRKDADDKKAALAQQEIDREKKIADLKKNLEASIVAGALSATDLLVKDAKKADKIQRAIALAQIGIDTAKAISSLVAMSQGNPLNVPTAGLAGAVQYAAGIAQILGNMAQAAKLLKAPAPNVGGAASGGASSASASFGVPINSVNSGSTLIGNGNNNKETFKVIVTETDITNTQNQVNQIMETATVV